MHALLFGIVLAQAVPTPTPALTLSTNAVNEDAAN